MFGYVRPVRDELKCKDFDLYRSTYCGLCRTIRKRCGLFATMMLNYDFTFLALLLSSPSGETVTRCHRCHVPPFRRCFMCESSAGLEQAADESIILAWWKVYDSIQDERGLKKLFWRAVGLLLRKGYRRAAAAHADFNSLVSQQMHKLRELELEQVDSLDRPADTFASILASAVPAGEDEGTARAMTDLLYHLGRWIYLIDARDDFEEDLRIGRYNPVRMRFGASGNDALLEQTLNRSIERMHVACALLDLGRQRPLVDNVLYIGIPMIQRAVFDGRWKSMKKQKIWRNNR